jgi:uncharacterized protein (DUF1778 family)
MTEPLFNLRLDDEDRALLEAVATHEKLTKSDVVRRAIRFYAARLGVYSASWGSQARRQRKR